MAAFAAKQEGVSSAHALIASYDAETKAFFQPFVEGMILEGNY